MNSPTKYERGQVWWWSDPVYGSKDEENIIPMYESGLRYSRYVVIVQDTETIDDNTITVVPLSSHPIYPNDRPVALRFHHATRTSYARVRFKMTVRPSTMVNYICKLSDTDMAMISAEIIRLEVPELYKSFDLNYQELKKATGIDLALANQISQSENLRKSRDGLKATMKDFIKEHIRYKKGNIIHSADLLYAFNQYCMQHEVQPLHDRPYFIKLFYDLMGTTVNWSLIKQQFDIDVVSVELIGPIRQELEIEPYMTGEMILGADEYDDTDDDPDTLGEAVEDNESEEAPEETSVEETGESTNAPEESAPSDTTPEYQRNKYQKIDQLVYEKMISMIKAGNKKIEIMRETGLSGATVYRYRKKYEAGELDIKPAEDAVPVKKDRKKCVKLSEEERKALYTDKTENHMKNAELARKYNVAPATVTLILREFQ